MKHFLFSLISFFFLASFCILGSDVAYTIPEKDLIPEGIAYSNLTGSFYVGSIFKRKIIQVDSKTGSYKDFIAEGTLDLSFLGIITDDSRGHLWACGNSPKKGGLSSICKFDLATGKLLKQYSYKDTAVNLYNDLTIDTKGNVYFTNSNGMRVYMIDSNTDSVSIFYDGRKILFPNGITISPDDKHLYIASHVHGIRVIDMEKREVISPPDTIHVSRGIDGLKYYNGSLVGVQNALNIGVDATLVRYYLDETGTRVIKMEVIDHNNPKFKIPTTAAIKDDHLYCLVNSQLRDMNFDEHKIIDPGKLQDVIIMKYGLK
jgi:streptogramin lyase